MPDDDMTLGEVGRRLVRIEDKLDLLGDASSRITRLEDAVKTADARAWQIRLALFAAFFALPASVIGAVLTAILLQPAH